MNISHYLVFHYIYTVVVIDYDSNKTNLSFKISVLKYTPCVTFKSFKRRKKIPKLKKKKIFPLTNDFPFYFKVVFFIYNIVFTQSNIIYTKLTSGTV